MIKMLAWGVAGLTLTGALTLGAFAIAGRSLSSPAVPLRMLVPSLVPTKGSDEASRPPRSPRPSHSPRPSQAPHNDTGTLSPPPVIVIPSSPAATKPPRDSGSDPSSEGGKPAGDD